MSEVLFKLNIQTQSFFCHLIIIGVILQQPLKQQNGRYLLMLTSMSYVYVCVCVCVYVFDSLLLFILNWFLSLISWKILKEQSTCHQ